MLTPKPGPGSAKVAVLALNPHLERDLKKKKLVFFYCTLRHLEMVAGIMAAFL